jgi:FixJ family two-component response regulator
MESAGYMAKGFGSAEEFLESGSTRNTACLIVDVQLPGITGLELQNKLGGADNPVPIVFVSTRETTENREKAIRQGAAGFLGKPFRREDLLSMIGAAIRR